jgi:AcrR family transcriptional regulator
VTNKTAAIMAAPARSVKAPGRRSGAAAAATRERILRQAQRLFARKGYGATSLRELASAAGVRLFTLQHHFGSKQALYAEMMRCWEREVRELLAPLLAERGDPAALVERVVDALFDFFLANRARVTISARAALGEGAPRRLVGDRGWVRLVGASLAEHRLSAAGLELGLLLITIEGVLHNHVLAAPHYRRLYGRSVSDAAVAARVKRHLTEVILRLVGGSGARSR